MIELKVLGLWIAIVVILHLICRIRYSITDSNLNWKTFRDDYCTFGAFYYAISRIGLGILTIYLFVRFSMWYFN